MSEREAFEQWAKSEGIDLKVMLTGDYYFATASLAYKGWQAARAQGAEPAGYVNKSSGGHYELYPAAPMADLPIGMHSVYTHPPAKVPEWVRCEDRLPELGEVVIAKYEDVYAYRLVHFWKDYALTPHFGLPNEPDGKGSQPATHWKPTGLKRPTPPQEQSDE